MFNEMEELEELDYHLTYGLFSIYQNPYFGLRVMSDANTSDQ